MPDDQMIEEVCPAKVYAGRLSQAMNTTGFRASDEALARGGGLRLPQCYLPAGHGGEHMLDPVMWEPPIEPRTTLQEESCRG